MSKVMNQAEGDGWKIFNGDSCEVIKEIPDESIGLSIFSPPFSALFSYSSYNADLSNCRNDEEFHEHFRFLVPELLRITKPGRICAFHCMNLPTSKERDGVIGLRDFRGDLIRSFVQGGWIYHSEVTIFKCPVVAVTRTKALGLLHKQLKKDSCMSRQGLADYLVVMRKPGVNAEPVIHTNETFPVAEWQRYASPVWATSKGVDEEGFHIAADDVNATRTLQSMKAEGDTAHLCPLQIEVVDRAIRMWSNKGDVVFSPFGGIGTEPYCAVKAGRRALAIELKPEYFFQAEKNMRKANAELNEQTLFADQVEELEQIEEATE